MGARLLDTEVHRRTLLQGVLTPERCLLWGVEMLPVNSLLLGCDSGMVSLYVESQGPWSELGTQVATWTDVWSSWEPLCPHPPVPTSGCLACTPGEPPSGAQMAGLWHLEVLSPRLLCLASDKRKYNAQQRGTPSDRVVSCEVETRLAC